MTLLVMLSLHCFAIVVMKVSYLFVIKSFNNLVRTEHLTFNKFCLICIILCCLSSFVCLLAVHNSAS